MLNIKLTVQQAEQMQHVTQILAYLFVGLATIVCLINLVLFIWQRLNSAKQVPSGLTMLTIIFSFVSLFLGSCTKTKMVLVFLLLTLDPQNWFMLRAIWKNFFNRKC